MSVILGRSDGSVRAEVSTATGRGVVGQRCLSTSLAPPLPPHRTKTHTFSFNNIGKYAIMIYCVFKYLLRIITKVKTSTRQAKICVVILDSP